MVRTGGRVSTSLQIFSIISMGRYRTNSFFTNIIIARATSHTRRGIKQEAQLSLTSRAMLFCKVVEVLQDVLSD